MTVTVELMPEDVPLVPGVQIIPDALPEGDAEDDSGPSMALEKLPLQVTAPISDEINLPAPQPSLAPRRITLPSVPPGALISGIVTSVTADEPMTLRYDWGQVLTRLALVGALLGGLALLLAFVSWWIMLGILVSLILITALMRGLGMIAKLFGQLLSIGVVNNSSDGMGSRGFHWSVLEPQTRQVTSGRLVRRRAAAGHLSPGDIVSVYGRLQRNNLVEAQSIIITQHVGNPTWSKIEGAAVWPIWVGVLAWIAVLGGLWWLAIYLGVA